MGDPRKKRKRFQKPSHPWQKGRLEEESVYIKDFGLKNKKEIWRAKSQLKHFSDNAKNLVRVTGEQADKEQLELIKKLQSIGLMKDSNINNVLTLSVRDLLERRLQTIVVRKGLARSLNQARQFITHGHIAIGNQKVTVPSYTVKIDEENDVGFAQNSALTDTEHPERMQKEQEKSPAVEENEAQRD